jgi:murein DD-endopeptidase MepM/ murein hydrolase activator NlpD
VILSEADGGKEEIHLGPALERALALAGMLAALLVGTGFVFVAKYVDLAHRYALQTREIAWLRRTAREDRAVVAAYRHQAAVEAELAAQSKTLLAALRRAERSVGIIDGYGLPSVSGMRQAEDALRHIQALLPELVGRAKDQAVYLAHRPDMLPVSGRIASGWGWRQNPLGGLGTEFHDGVDLAVAPGTPVHAVADGVVAYAGWYSGYGLYVLIDHGYGIQSFYGHNSRLLVHTGEVVKRGETIALSGDTGWSTGPHVHFGIHVDGLSVNPLEYVFADPLKTYAGPEAVAPAGAGSP